MSTYDTNNYSQHHELPLILDNGSGDHNQHDRDAAHRRYLLRVLLPWGPGNLYVFVNLYQ
jgi:hypothetical protein